MNPVRVSLTRVHIPAISTTGYGYGQLEDGTSAVIVADQKAMRGLGQAMGEGKPPVVVYAEVVATGEVADDIARQWHEQWAISDTQGSQDPDRWLSGSEDGTMADGERIDRPREQRTIRRDARGRFTSNQVNGGRLLAEDRRTAAKQR